MIPRPRTRRFIVGLAASLLVAATLAVSACFAVHGILSRRADELFDRSLLHATTIASTVPA